MKIIKYNHETVNCTCGGCPMVYEFEDVYGNEYYFRLRHGYWYLMDETNDVEICGGKTNRFGGMCSWTEFVEFASDYVILLENI